MNTEDHSTETERERTADSKTYWSDYPITAKEEDRFNRWPFAQRIADTIARRGDPSGLVIGIYGAWGDGKTSVLHLMEEALKSYNEAIVVRFNPWHFESEDRLLRGFFDTLADALKKSLRTKVEELGKILDRYGSIFSWVSVGGVQELGKTLSTVELDELRQRVDRILKESGNRVVVLIDDIDRLDRREIQALFKLGLRVLVWVILVGKHGGKPHGYWLLGVSSVA